MGESDKRSARSGTRATGTVFQASIFCNIAYMVCICCNTQIKGDRSIMRSGWWHQLQIGQLSIYPTRLSLCFPPCEQSFCHPTLSLYCLEVDSQHFQDRKPVFNRSQGKKSTISYHIIASSAAAIQQKCPSLAQYKERDERTSMVRRMAKGIGDE